MKKITNFITSLILGIIAIVFSVLFYSYFTQFNALQKNIEGSGHVYYGGNEVKILSQKINSTCELNELYVTKKTDRTVGDLLNTINKKRQIFNLSEPTLGMGRYVVGINGHNALWQNGSYWQIISPTLNQKMTFNEFNNKFNINEDFSPYVKDWSVDVGIDFFPLVTDTVVIFYETKVK